jgi:hypothetical protein
MAEYRSLIARIIPTQNKRFRQWPGCEDGPVVAMTTHHFTPIEILLSTIWRNGTAANLQLLDAKTQYIQHFTGRTLPTGMMTFNRMTLNIRKTLTFPKFEV